MVAIAVSIDPRSTRAKASLGTSAGALLGRAYRWVRESWPVRGYREAKAGHLAAIVAFNALIALAPTLLLLVAVGGLVLRDDRVLAAAVEAIGEAMPAAGAREALEAILSARRYTGVFGLVSLAGFFWIGANFADAVAHCLNRVHGVGDCGYVCTRRKAFGVVIGASGLFVAAAVAGASTLVAGLESGLQSTVGVAWARPWLGYLVGFAAALALFLLLYRVLPNAGQRLGDVWPGALVAALLFVLLGQVFPLYLWLVGGANRFGAAFGLVWLLVTWFAALGHVLLFGAYVNATLMRRRLRRTGRTAAGPRPPMG